jgi:hypothetical protein
MADMDGPIRCSSLMLEHEEQIIAAIIRTFSVSRGTKTAKKYGFTPFYCWPFYSGKFLLSHGCMQGVKMRDSLLIIHKATFCMHIWESIIAKHFTAGNISVCRKVEGRNQAFNDYSHRECQTDARKRVNISAVAIRPMN